MCSVHLGTWLPTNSDNRVCCAAWIRVNMFLFVCRFDQHSRHDSKPGAEGAVSTLAPGFQPTRMSRVWHLASNHLGFRVRVLRCLDPVEHCSVRPPPPSSRMIRNQESSL